MAMDSHKTRSPSTRVGIRVRIEADILHALQFVSSSALLYQLIWFAHLLKHPQASHRSGPGISVELKHRVAPKHIAPVDANATAAWGTTPVWTLLAHRLMQRYNPLSAPQRKPIGRTSPSVASVNVTHDHTAAPGRYLRPVTNRREPVKI